MESLQGERVDPRAVGFIQLAQYDGIMERFATQEGRKILRLQGFRVNPNLLKNAPGHRMNFDRFQARTVCLEDIGGAVHENRLGHLRPG